VNFLSKNNKWLLPVLYGLAGIAWGILLRYMAPLSNYEAWCEQNVAAISLSLCCIIALWLVRTYPTKVGVITYAVFIGIGLGVLAWSCDYYFLGWWLKGNAGYQVFLHNTAIDRLIMAEALLLPLTLITAMNKRVLAIEERFYHQNNAESLLREAELFKLRQQLQPHFLYNSLNAINSLVLVAPDKAQEMVGRLSDFMRASVKKDSNEPLPVAEELIYLESYLAIESVRFGDRLQVQFKKEYTDDARMPPFLVQPLIENAIKFGLYGQIGVVAIGIHIYMEDTMLVIVITNPYDPLMKPQAGTGFGLAGIRRRLYLLYGRDDLLQAVGEAEQFTTTLQIPQSHV